MCGIYGAAMPNRVSPMGGMPNIPSTLKIQYYFENNTEFLDNTGVARLSPDNAVKFWFRSVNYQEPLLYL